MKRDEQLFTQCTTSDYFFVSEGTHVEITEVEIIRGESMFFIKWKQGGRNYSKFLTIDCINYIIKSHENWLGKTSHSYLEWKCTLNDAIAKEEQMKKVGI